LPISRTLSNGMICKDCIASRVGAEEHSAIVLAQGVVFNEYNPRRCACTGAIAGRHDAWVLLVPVRRKHILPWPMISAPVSCAIGAEVSRVATFHDPRCSAREHLVVIVVLPHVSAGVDKHFIRVAEVVGHHLHVFTGRVYSESQSANPYFSIVALQIALVGGVVWRSSGVYAS